MAIYLLYDAFLLAAAITDILAEFLRRLMPRFIYVAMTLMLTRYAFVVI